MLEPTPKTQKQRSDESRHRIITAANKCMVELGYQGTSFASIAKLGGISVGAIQHQFGDKAELLFAVVEASLMARAAAFSLEPIEGPNKKARLATFVNRMWFEGYGGAEYATAIEILIAMRKDPKSSSRSNDYFAKVLSIIDRLWMGVFWDFDSSREKHVIALRLTFNVLNGMALQQLVCSLKSKEVNENLDHLIEAVAALLELED